MTSQEPIDSGRFDDAFAIVEALLDGERVDTESLKTRSPIRRFASTSSISSPCGKRSD